MISRIPLFFASGLLPGVVDVPSSYLRRETSLQFHSAFKPVVKILGSVF